MNHPHANPGRRSPSRIKAIAASLALLCSFPVISARADTVLIYDAALSFRNYTYGKTSRDNSRDYVLFDTTTAKVGMVYYRNVKGRKSYELSGFPTDDFVQASVATSGTTSSTFFVMIQEAIYSNGRSVFQLQASGANQLMDLGGGHVGKFPRSATGSSRLVSALTPPYIPSVQTGIIALRLVPSLTTKSNTADANLSQSIQIVTDDLASRGFQGP